MMIIELFFFLLRLDGFLGFPL
uniref:Uncharacterized protein n=1 Tax=Anguilla anguilla TaxID=7936 RepID=A0A0E9VDF4_ANGAN